MYFRTLVTFLALALQQQAVASPTGHRKLGSILHEKRGIDCAGAIPFLSGDDCNHLSQLGFAQAGVNSGSAGSASSVWVGSDGHYTAEFSNGSGENIVLVLWNQDNGFASSFVQTVQPQLTISVPANGAVVVSFGDTASGAWSALNSQTAMDNGQISNTWGEFSTGDFATVDVSREVNMSGSGMSITTPVGCVSDLATCVFVCNSGNKCGEANTYSLLNCVGPGAASGTSGGQPSGGCQGWTSGSQLKVAL